jgi:hypothetical protein
MLFQQYSYIRYFGMHKETVCNVYRSLFMRFIVNLLASQLSQSTLEDQLNH